VASSASPLSPQRKWRAIAVATVVLVVAFWSMLAGVVAGGSDEPGGADQPAALVALGLVLIPFVFVALAFLSEHPSWPGAVARAMGLSVVVGVVVSAVAADAVTGIVAGVGAGGVVALRRDDGHTWQARAVGVALAAAYAFLLVRTAGAIVLVPAPILPLTAIGVADHVAERRLQPTKT
jgi:hypothetical protein